MTVGTTTPPLTPNERMFKSQKPESKPLSWYKMVAVAAMVYLAYYFVAGNQAICSNYSKHSIIGALCDSDRSVTQKLFQIAYPLQNPNHKGNSKILDESDDTIYYKGPQDVFFVLGWICVLGLFQKYGTRLLKGIGQKITVHVVEAKEKAPVADRFAEQAYLLIWYCLSISFGLYIWAHQKYAPFNLYECWTDAPVYKLPMLIKSYYLVQSAFWLQQLALYLLFTPKSERRSDHYQMTAHHAITTGLVLSSYIFHCTRIGNVVLVIMDTADVFLCSAKCLKYLGPKFAGICDFVFGLFAVSWLITRHFLFFFVIRSIYYDAVTELEHKPWDPYFFRADGDYERPGQYFAIGTWIMFLSLFAALQSLLIFWFMLIVKVVVKVLNGKELDDVRENE